MCLMGKMYSKWSHRWECLRGRSRGGDDQGKIPQWDVLRGRHPRGDVLGGGCRGGGVALILGPHNIANRASMS